MTYRERKEARLEKRLDWAAGRREKAASLRATTDRYRGDVAFNTQPGHIPERARIIQATDKAAEHQGMAAEHESKAAEISRQLDRSIYDDDPDAISQIEARITKHEAQRARMVLVNKLYKKGNAEGLTALGLDLDRIKAKLAAAGGYWGKAPHLPYEMSNLSGRIGADRKRLEAIKARQERAARAETSETGVLIEGEAWVRVTFAEKPERSIIEALKAAGFSWGAGHWIGERAKLPAEVTA
jgi:hypothetical protein